MSSKATSKYLDQYSEPEILSLNVSLGLCFERCLVIPAFAESTNFIKRIIQTWGEDQNLLVILVVNQPTDSTPQQSEEAIRCLHSTKALLPEILASGGELSWRKASSIGPTFLLVDRCLNLPIPKEQGVGLARKIGCDIALALSKESVLRSDWVHTTDADAHLPHSYFDIAYRNCAAIIYPHKYREAESALFQATKIYDARMLDYRTQLAKAGSSYAYNPTGSLLAINLTRYAEARGFPKRAGGEDFYLLNKLQKLGGVESIDYPEIELECRESYRVPFGTGPAVSKLLKLASPEEEPIFYHPACFESLAEGWQCLRSESPQSWSKDANMSKEFLSALEHIGLASAQKHLTPYFDKDIHQYQFHLSLWFDAFRTLKTVHYLRDNYYGCINYRQWCDLNT